jgi:hypothetical protein
MPKVTRTGYMIQDRKTGLFSGPGDTFNRNGKIWTIGDLKRHIKLFKNDITGRYPKYIDDWEVVEVRILEQVRTSPRDYTK